jgi:uncharacterized protein
MYSIFDAGTRARFDLEEVEIIHLNGKPVAICPDTGGWAVLEAPELYSMFLPHLSQERGEELYRRGLARKNGASVYLPPHPSKLKGLRLFEFHMTDGCNLRCDYCNVDARTLDQATRPTPEVAERLIDRIVEYCQNHAIFQATVEFSGGEPCTCFDIIEHTCLYASRKLREVGFPRKLSFRMQTNLAIPWEEEWLRCIKEFRIGLGVSIDGPKECHDRHRKLPNGQGSWDLVMENLLRLKAEGMVSGAICVITPETVSEMPTIAKFFLDLGLNAFVLSPLLLAGRASSQMQALDPGRFVQGLFQVFDEVLVPSYEATGEIPLEREIGLAFLNFIQPARYFMCWRTPCGAGTNMCAVTSSGDVFPCGLWVNEPEFRMGNIELHSFDELIESRVASTLRERVIQSVQGCSRCLYRAWCQSRCPFSAYVQHRDIFKPSGYCAIMIELFSEMLGRAASSKLNEQAVRALAQKARM